MQKYTVICHDRNAYPLGLTKITGGIHVSVEAAAECCSLLLFSPSEDEEDPVRIPFPGEGRMGDVWEMNVLGDGLEALDYAFEADGKPFPDPCGRVFKGRERWGDTSSARALLRSPVEVKDFDWEGDQPLRIPYEDCVVYRAHVRGFTMHRSSGVRNKGTFRGVAEKIPYMKELGITTLELLPVTEFREVILPKQASYPGGQAEPDGRLNYWGYAPALNFAPKASYAAGGREPDLELKQLVKELHRAGIELVTELYFTGQERPGEVVEAVRYWVREYHLDGIHLTGNAPLWLLARDPYLTGVKLWATSWEDVPERKGPRYLGEYNDGFLVDMRRALKGEEGQMNGLAFRSRENPDGRGVIHYMASTNGFTMMDMVSYEQKHNEANGEQGKDGNPFNYSWNCGAEGPSRKKAVTELRRKQLRGAFLLLFLSQGTPMLLSGDEFGQTQGGNNNAYCQDNPTAWLDWRLLKKNQGLFTFVKQLIAFRKAHPVFHRSTGPRLMDTLACGHPDLSYHGAKAWVPDFDYFCRHLGILYWGAYGVKPDGTTDDTFYLACNFHEEPQELGLPHLPKGMDWHIALDTGNVSSGGFYPEGEEPRLDTQRQVTVPGRTVLLLVGKETVHAQL